MQRKRRNVNFGNFSKSPGKYQKKFTNSITKLTLHSIPAVRMSESNKKSNARIKLCLICGKEDIYQPTSVVWWCSPHCRSGERRNRTRASHVVMTPLSRLARYPRLVLVFLGLGLSVLTNFCFNVERSFAALESGSAWDIDTISPVITDPPTAGLTLSKANMTSEAVTPGNTATASTNVTVNVSNAESYELYLKVNSATMSNGSTTITAGNVITDNTWGYKWDNASSYSAPSTSGSKLTVPALSDNATNFTKTLTFATRFATSATPGNYRNSGTLSLIAPPKAITLDDLTQMQQLSLAPSACANTPYLSGQTYSKGYTLTDVRDGNKYTVRKFGDGRCWMTENLRLAYINYYLDGTSAGFLDGRVLSATTSDFTGSDITLPNSTKADFANNNTSKYSYRSYLSTSSEASAGVSGYYNWYTATAGAGNSSVTANNQSVNTSICPKGWKLPSGGSNSSTSEFSKFASAESIADSAAGSTKIQAAPYNFKYTGYVEAGSLQSGVNNGQWWSSVTSDDYHAYYLFIQSINVLPGTNYSLGRHSGFAVRCIARDS